MATKHRRNHKQYVRSLNRLIDLIFEDAYKQQMNWGTLAARSGLSYGTIVALGNRRTLYPQYRTVELLAQAVGGHVMFSKRRSAAPVITWTPKVFSAA